MICKNLVTSLKIKNLNNCQTLVLRRSECEALKFGMKTS